MSEKARLLSVASREEWRRWAKNPMNYFPPCLLCMAYKQSCKDCKIAGGHDPREGGCCPQRHKTGLTQSESAIERLKRAEIWEDQP